MAFEQCSAGAYLLTAQLCIRIYPLGLLNIYSSQYLGAWRNTLFCRILPFFSPGRRVLFLQAASGPCSWLVGPILCLSVEPEHMQTWLRATPVATSLPAFPSVSQVWKEQECISVSCGVKCRPSFAA